MTLKFGSSEHFSGQVPSKILLQDNSRFGIGGEVAVERHNLPTHAPDRLYDHCIYIGCDATQEKR
jgi:hypothetical protein